MGGYKDILLAASALSAVLAGQQNAFAQDKAGVASVVNANATSIRESRDPRTVHVGDAVFMDERITTDASGSVNLMLLDQTAFTIGPNGDLTIDKFIYDPETKIGEMSVSALTGVFRVIGGQLTKTGSLQIKTPVSTIGIRGGIGLFSIGSDGTTRAIFVFGEQITVTNNGGETETVTRPGYMVTIGADGEMTVEEAPDDLIANIVSALQQPGGSSGETTTSVTIPAGPGGSGGEQTVTVFPIPPGAVGTDPEAPSLGGLRNQLGLDDADFDRLQDLLDTLATNVEAGSG